MKRTLLILALAAVGAPAFAQTIPSPPPAHQPLVPEAGEPALPVPAKRPPPPAVTPIPYVYRQIDRMRINDGTTIPGRTNAVGGQVQDQRTGWNAPGLGGNAM